MTARESILECISRSLADGPSLCEFTPAFRVSAPDGTDLGALFAERVSAYRATVHRCSRQRLPLVVAEALSTRGARRAVVPRGVDRAWLSNAQVDALADDPPLSHEELDALDGVITGCAVAVAETGTIVLDGGVDQGRRALSLLPDYHLCVVRIDQIVGTVPEALQRLDPRRPLTWVSGPSATSDIELERVEGVHGPRVLEVIVVDAPPGRHSPREG